MGQAWVVAQSPSTKHANGVKIPLAAAAATVTRAEIGDHETMVGIETGDTNCIDAPLFQDNDKLTICAKYQERGAHIVRSPFLILPMSGYQIASAPFFLASFPFSPAHEQVRSPLALFQHKANGTAVTFRFVPP
jgi:hypothetical protein